MGGPRWEVVGGSARGGILVSSGRDLSSRPLATRLETGAVVRQQCAEGDRVLYALLAGAGPAEGWVSVSAEGEALLAPLAEAAPPALAQLDRMQDLDVQVMTLGQGVVANLRLCRSATWVEVHDKLSSVLGEHLGEQDLVVGTQILEGTVCLGDIVDGGGPVKMTLVQNPPMALAALVGSRSGALQLWDLESGEAIREFEGHRSQVKCAALHVVSRRAVTGSKDGSLRLWDIRQVRPLLVLAAHQDGVNCVAVDWPSFRALTGGEDRMLRLWDLEYAELLVEMAGHTLPVTSVVWDPELDCALSGSRDCTLRIWAAETGECFRELRDLAPVNCVAANFPLQIAISGSIAVVRIWYNIISDAQEYYRDWEGHSGWVVQVASDWPRQITLGLDREGTLRLLGSGGVQELRVGGGGGRATCAAPLWSSSRFLVGSDDGTMYLWSESGELDKELPGHGSGTACLALDGAVAGEGSQAEKQKSGTQSIVVVMLSLPLDSTRRNVFHVMFVGASYGASRARPTIGTVRKQLAENHQVPDLGRLRFRRRGREGLLADCERAPVPPMELEVTGPGDVVESLRLAMQAGSVAPPPNAVY